MLCGIWIGYSREMLKPAVVLDSPGGPVVAEPLDVAKEKKAREKKENRLVSRLSSRVLKESFGTQIT